MRTRILSTVVLVLALAACSKEKEKQPQAPAPTAPAPQAAQTPPPASPAPQSSESTAQTGAEPSVHGASPAPRSRPPAENPGPWQKKALQGEDLYATLETSEGNVVLKLFSKQSPLTVANFVGLATGEQAWTDPRTNQTVTGKPLYQNVIFHRVIPDFMIQGGDPLGEGRGSPGYTFEDETQNGLTFDKPGLLAMANRGPNTNGCQFFITVAPQPRLNGGYTIFGEVVKGYDVVERISKVPTVPPNRPVKDVVIKKVAVSDTQPK